VVSVSRYIIKMFGHVEVEGTKLFLVEICLLLTKR
jgi:hypothetical protein